MVLTDEIKDRIREDIKVRLENSHNIAIFLKNYGIKSTRDTREEIMSWLKSEFDIVGEIEPSGDMLEFNIKWKNE